MKKLALSDEILLSVEKPSRYIGREYNSYNKEFGDYPVRVAFCFPDVYDIATANLGMQIIYEQFNRRPDAMCDRVYSPWIDLDRIMREKKIPLFAVESQRPVREFDFLLVTLQYEMCYTNVLQVLDLSGIPLHASERTEEDPIVIGGGACAYNPEPIAEFFDVFYIGESETRYDEMTEVYKKAKAEGKTRTEILKLLANLEGLYVPRFYDVDYREDGTIGRFYRTTEDVPEKIRRQAADMRDDTLPYPMKPIVPFTRGMMDRATLEVMRGCIRGCRFCQAGMIYRPTRNRNPEFLKKAAVSMLKSSGYEEINLSSLATSDYSDFAEIVDFLIPYCDAHKINVGIPSLRIDAFSLDVMDKIQDVKEIAVLSDKIARVYYETVPKEKRQGRVEITPSTSFFVPKPFTPFQWAKMDRPEEFLRKAHLLKDTLKEQLNQKSIFYRYHDEVQTELEGLFARGDRRVAAAIEAAYTKGCIYDAWSEYMKPELWKEALEETGISLDCYNYRERSTDEILPWSFIDVGVSASFMKREWENAKAGVVTPNCREKCSKCGAARYEGGVCYENQM